MVRQLTTETYSPPSIQLPMEEYVGRGTGGAGHSGSFAWGAAGVTWPYHCSWGSIISGAVFQNILGVPTVTNNTMYRAVPMTHPIFPMWANGITGFNPLKITGKGNLFNGPFSTYDRVAISVSFQAPAFSILTDAQMAPFFMVGTTTPPIVVTGTTTIGSPIVTSIIPNITSGNPRICVGQLITGAGIFQNTYVKSVDSISQITMSRNASATGSSVTLNFAGIFPQEQYRFCQWRDDSNLQVAQRDGYSFIYTETGGGAIPGPPVNTQVKGFKPVQRKTKTLTCDWRMVHPQYIRNANFQPSNLDLLHGRVNLFPFATPKGTYPAGTCLLKDFKTEDEIAPIFLQLQNGQVNALQRVRMIFEVFDDSTLKNPNTVAPQYGFNDDWYPDGYYYRVGAVQVGGVTPVPPFPVGDFQSIFLQAF